jgi:hypothetical protein
MSLGFLNGVFTTNSLTFSLTPAAVDKLDFYKRGTFTCEVGGAATAGTPTYNTNGSVARFERIGKRVWISVLHSWSALAGAAGGLAALGGAYPSANLTGVNVNLQWCLDTNWGILTNALASGAGTIPQARIGVNSNRVDFLNYDLTTGVQTSFPVAGSGSYTINGFYEVD